jgi:hypothetical protein
MYNFGAASVNKQNIGSSSSSRGCIDKIRSWNVNIRYLFIIVTIVLTIRPIIVAIINNL